MKKIMIVISVLFAVVLMASSPVERVEENNSEEIIYYMMFCGDCGWEWGTLCGEPEDESCPNCYSYDVSSFPSECGEYTPDFVWHWQCSLDASHRGKCEVNQDPLYCWQKITYSYPMWRCYYCGYGQGYVTWTKVILVDE
jgi:hypothetical protein